MSAGWYLTGTDTGVGKTFVACALIRALVAEGTPVGAMKPVASGAKDTTHGLRNEDALALLEALPAPKPSYADVNPYVLKEAIAPHLAAAIDGVTIDPAAIASRFRGVAAGGATMVVEGVGGWSVPIGGDAMQSDLVRALGLPVVIVVGLRLGCINHALLTARAIRADRCAFGGWFANTLDPDLAHAGDVIATIAGFLGKPIATLPRDGALDASALALLRLADER